VTDGIVRIHGRADTRTTAELIERFVVAVPGVIGIEADLTWELDDRRIDAPATDLIFPPGAIR
jgi:hypothetical protein